MLRVYHPWDVWECYKAGFFESTPPIGVDKEQALIIYKELLQDLPRFQKAMERVAKEWPNSCRQFLTNTSMNRIAWLGQASVCISSGVPSCFRAGFKLLNEEEQKAANSLAKEFLIKWESIHANKAKNIEVYQGLAKQGVS